jgi:SPFH domain / Band 7 family
MTSLAYVFWLLVIIGVAFFAISSFKQVTQGSEALVERLGRYHRKLGPGINFGIFPFVDEVVVEATTRERPLDVEVERAITKDNFPITLDIFFYYKIIDLYQAYYGVDDVEDALQSMVSTSLRVIVGRLYLDEVSASIKQNLLTELDRSTDEWGVRITRLDITINREPELDSAIFTPAIVSFDIAGEIEWQAYNSALSRLQAQGVTLIFQGADKDSKDSGKTIVRAKYYPEALDRDKVYNDFQVAYGVYRSELIDSRRSGSKILSKEQEFQEKVNYKLENIQQQIQALSAASSRAINIFLNNQNGSVTGGLRMENEQNPKVEIGSVSGNVGAVSAGDLSQQNQGLTNFGEISGSVTNTINQLQTSTSPETAQLADLLKQLQTAIEAETNLDSDEKAMALEQTGKLAEAAQNLGDDSTKKPAKLAIGFLKGLTTSLPAAATLAEACSKLLPMITALLGL